ncbi:hypothetical protein ACFW8Z_20700, partial [Streptomyces sp. NPDC059515]
RRRPPRAARARPASPPRPRWSARAPPGARRGGRPPHAMSSPDGHLLLFGLLPERSADVLPPFTATDETDGRRLMRRPEELAFPLHTLAARAWFEGRYI